MRPTFVERIALYQYPIDDYFLPFVAAASVSAA
jgi:hypothetical protein